MRFSSPPRLLATLLVLAAGTAVLTLPGLARAQASPADGAAARPVPAAVAAPIRPDPKLTPGDTLDVTLEDIRTPGYSSRVRNVPVGVKREVYADYGILRHGKGEYEVDHLIPLSLGGSNSKRNLWPQSYLTRPWNAHVKDALEYRLLKLVRAGKVDLKTAQGEMARDWIAAYQKYVSPTPKVGRGGRTRVIARGADLDGDGQPDQDESSEGAPMATVPAKPTERQLGADARPDTATGGAAPTAAAAQVWVNTKSGVIWRPGSRYFGKTAQGKYMTEAEALAAGFHLPKGNQ